jgi:ABC-type transport system involved in multi-copper enzyme maturation permease subunit
VNKIFAIARAVVADAVRRKVVWAVIVFCALLSIATPSLPSYGVGVVAAVYREVSIALMYAAALVVALALATTRIPVEVEKRTVFNVIARDVRRWQYVTGTWLGMFIVLGAVTLAFTLATMLIGFIDYHQPMFILLEAALAIWLEMGVIMGIAVMFSSQFGAVTSVVGALAFTFVAHADVGLLHLSEGQLPPWWLPGLDIFNVINPVAHGGGYSLVYALSMVAAAAAWIAIFLLGGSLMFGARDL